jgi:SM-20-related protein
VDSFNKPPPCWLVRSWLGKETINRLLSYAQSNEHLFRDSDLGYGEKLRVDKTLRQSRKLHGIGDFKGEVRAKMRNLLPAMFEKLGNKPFIPHTFELELVTHGDGAFFVRHIDTTTHQEHLDSHRVISAVYYFYALPKAFSGGVLRLHSLAATGQQGTFIDITPDYDTLVFFPSMFPHEVLPVNCPSRQFLDSRFSINCWIHRA